MPEHVWDVYEDTATGQATAHCRCGFSASGSIEEIYNKVHNHL